MGALYEKARLVIAASHAEDGTEGCFFEREPPSSSISILYTDPVGEITSSVHIALDGKKEETEEGDPQKGPLATRGWITQEWLLARRMVLYTKTRLAWSCNTLQAGEEGRVFPTMLDDHKSTHWQAIISSHSARELTMPTDRLDSIEGLRAEMQKKTDEDYLYGMWSENLSSQLLWWPKVGPAKREANPLRKTNASERLPTWTWASCFSPIVFHDDYEDNWGYRMEEESIKCGSISFADDALVVSAGRVKKMARLTDPRMDDSDGEEYCVELERFDMCEKGEQIGYVTFDEGEIPKGGTKSLFCLLLMQKRGSVEEYRYERHLHFLVLQREGSNDCADGDENEADGEEQESSEEDGGEDEDDDGEGDDDGEDDDNEEEDDGRGDEDSGEEEEEEEDGTYIRVGTGCITEKEDWFRDAKKVKLRIV
jgi:hypothetical protein